MKSRRRRASLPSITCPHCQSVAAIRTSEAVSELLRQIRFRCENDDCGHVFTADLIVVRTIVPSACPNPKVELPLGHRVQRPANDDNRTPANDDDAPSSGVSTPPS